MPERCLWGLFLMYSYQCEVIQKNSVDRYVKYSFYILAWVHWIKALFCFITFLRARKVLYLCMRGPVIFLGFCRPQHIWKLRWFCHQGCLVMSKFGAKTYGRKHDVRLTPQIDQIVLDKGDSKASSAKMSVAAVHRWGVTSFTSLRKASQVHPASLLSNNNAHSCRWSLVKTLVCCITHKSLSFYPGVVNCIFVYGVATSTLDEHKTMTSPWSAGFLMGPLGCSYGLGEWRLILFYYTLLIFSYCCHDLLNIFTLGYGNAACWGFTFRFSKSRKRNYRRCFMKCMQVKHDTTWGHFFSNLFVRRNISGQQ